MKGLSKLSIFPNFFKEKIIRSEIIKSMTQLSIFNQLILRVNKCIDDIFNDKSSSKPHFILINFDIVVAVMNA